tara:strand:- start:1626 stop:1982 length:357 start_codon:yes stop_codon:yes gene_type:complete
VAPRSEKLSTKKGVFALGAKLANRYQHTVIAEPSKHQGTKKTDEIIALQKQPQTRDKLASRIRPIRHSARKRTKNVYYLRLFCTHLSALHLDWSISLTFSLTFLVYIFLHPLFYNGFS